MKPIALSCMHLEHHRQGKNICSLVRKRQTASGKVSEVQEVRNSPLRMPSSRSRYFVRIV